MAVDNNAVTVNSTATRLDTADDSADHQAGESILIYNDSATVFYVGGPSVTASGAKKGIPVAANSYGPSLDVEGSDAVYGITASGTATAIVLARGV